MIIKGHISKDHVHLFVSAPPDYSVSELVKKIKGKSSLKVISEFEAILKQFWGRHFWGRGYLVANLGNVTDEVIREYINNQEIKTKDDNFKIGGSGMSSYDDIPQNPAGSIQYRLHLNSLLSISMVSDLQQGLVHFNNSSHFRMISGTEV